MRIYYDDDYNDDDDVFVFGRGWISIVYVYILKGKNFRLQIQQNEHLKE